MKQLHVVCLAISHDSMAKLLGYDSVFDYPRGVRFLPVRLDGRHACFDFISDEPFEIGGIQSLVVQDGCPLPWSRPEEVSK